MRVLSLLSISAALYATSLEAKPTIRCGTQLYWPRAVSQPPANLPRQAVAQKTLHKPFGDFPNVTQSEHFAFQAGGAAPDPERTTHTRYA